MKQKRLPFRVRIPYKSAPGRLLAVVGFVLLVAGIGGTIIKSQAATYNLAIEVETGEATGKMATDCVNREYSGGRSAKFGWASCQSEHSKMFTNPVTLNRPDPGIFQWQGKYYLVGTSGGPSYPIIVSDDLVNWRDPGKAVFDGTHPWGKSQFWAPELHRLANGKFAVYYNAFDGKKMHIGVATADEVLGPYTDLGRPLISESFNIIDVNFFRDDDSRQYLYWKEDGGNTRIFAQEVDATGINFIGQRKVVLQKGLSWEGSKGIEGTWVTKKNGQYYMFYSGELYSTDKYAVGVARAASPLASFTKKGDPILRSSNRWKGPGHNSVVQVGPNDYMVYHAWDRVAGIGDRDVLIDRIIWSNGWPTVASGTPTEAAQPYPHELTSGRSPD